MIQMALNYNQILRQGYAFSRLLIRPLSTSQHLSSSERTHFKLAVVGGGSGGAAISNAFSKSLGKENVAVIEPQDTHYYQPLWTLVGSGLKKFEQSAQPMAQVLKSSTWVKDGAIEFQPRNNSIVTGSGKTINGLEEGLRNYPEICTNYDARFVRKTPKALENFDQGVALFTMNMPIKCPGAPQKIMYLADDYFRQQGKRDKAKFIYCTASPQMLATKKYSDVLAGICQSRDMECHFFTKLVEIDPNNRIATFNILDKKFQPTGDQKRIKYDFIHVGPPFSAPEVLRKCAELIDSNGYLDVDKFTLQHTSFKNIFGIGDCTNLPNAKTAAAVAAEVGVLKKNLRSVMNKGQPTATYNGYSSCPIPTSSRTGILAEFDYDFMPLETFPINQAKERRIWYYMKADIIPTIYWRGLIKGIWHGPSMFRKLFRFGFSK